MNLMDNCLKLLKFMYPIHETQIIGNEKRAYLDIQVITHLFSVFPIVYYFYTGYYLLMTHVIITCYFSIVYHRHFEKKCIVFENVLAQTLYLELLFYSTTFLRLTFGTSMLLIFIFTNVYTEYYNKLHWINHILISVWCLFL